MRALTTAATGMQAQQLNVEVISNNLANMNTTGFKRQRAEFQDLLYQNVQLRRRDDRADWRPGRSRRANSFHLPHHRTRCAVEYRQSV